MKPIRSYKDKGLELAVWNKGKFSIRKQYFKKEGDGGQWVTTNTFFESDLKKLKEWIDLELANVESTEPQYRAIPLNELMEAKFDEQGRIVDDFDSEIPF